jgi:hypothetical protein
MLRKWLRTGKWIPQSLSVLLLVAPILTLTAHAVDQSTAQPPVSHRKARKKPEPLVLPPLPAGPLAQIPMDQMPAAAPKVTYENGMLAIAAQNSTLGEILRDVRQLTGATIDVPPSGANERVVVQLGPGAPRDVLAALLNGTSFNYVMLGSASDPKSVASVLLTSRSGGEVQTAVNTAVEGPTPFQQQQQQQQMQMQMPVAGRPMPNFRGPGFATPSPQPVVADDDADDKDDDDKDDDSDQAQTPSGQPIQPTLGPQADNQDQGNQPNAGPKTPEQILQMIRDGQRPVPPGMTPGQQPQQPPQE